MGKRKRETVKTEGMEKRCESRKNKQRIGKVKMEG